MFGFLRAVADNSESEVDQYSNDLQNTVNLLLDRGSRAEARARKGYIGNRVSRRLNNARALSTMDYSDDENDNTSLGLIDYDWSSNFHELGEDTDFWLANFLPEAPRTTSKPKVSRKDGGHIQLQINSRQRIFERMARRARNSRRVGSSADTLPRTPLVVEKEGTEEKVPSVLTSTGKKLKKANKQASKVQFPSDLGEDSDTKVTKWIHDDDHGDDDDDSDDDDIFVEDDEDEKQDIHSLEEVEEEDSEISNIPDYACKYCRYNPYTNYIREAQVPENLLTQSQLPYIYGNTAKQLIADLPSRTMAKLQKIYTTTFSKDVEQVVLGLKKGVCLSAKVHDSIAEAGPRNYPKNINTSAKICNSFFKICVDTVYGQNTCTPKGLQARNDKLVDKANVYIPTKYGIVLAVKDEYALSNILAIAQYHYVHATLLPSSQVSLLSLTVDVMTNMGDHIAPSVHTLVSTIHSASVMGFTHFVYLRANCGFCTCIIPSVPESAISARLPTLDTLQESLPYSIAHCKALDIP